MLMKKLLLLLAGAMLAFGFTACGDKSDDGPAAYTPVTVSSSTAGKSASYMKDVTVDVALTDAAMKTYVVGSDATALFEQSTVTSSRASVSADDGLKNLKATIKAITASSFTVTFTATTSASNCTVVVTAVIPADLTKDGVTVVKNVEKVTVGEGAGVQSASTMSLSGISIPTAAELAGKTFYDRSDSTKIKTYVFDSTGLKATRTKAGSSSTSTYEYTPETGLFMKAGEKAETPFDADYLAKLNGAYYIYSKGARLDRVSGSGLSGEFRYSASETGTMSGNGKTVTARWDLFYSLVINGDGTYTGKLTYSATVDGQTYGEGTNLLSGVYTNTDGLVTVKGKATAVETYTDSSGNKKTRTETKEYENGIAFYTGDSLWMVNCRLSTD